MHIYRFYANYNKMKENNQDKIYSIYIDGNSKYCGNIIGFINSTHPGNINKLPECVFVECEENRVVVTTIKSIPMGKELLVNYNLNRI